jgi:hypothetical protein
MTPTTPTPPRSKCCNAEVDEDEFTQPIYYCLKCGDPCGIAPAQPTGDEQPAEQGEWEIAEIIDSCFECNYREEGDYYHVPVQDKEALEKAINQLFRQQIAQAVAKKEEECRQWALACVGEDYDYLRDKPCTICNTPNQRNCTCSDGYDAAKQEIRAKLQKEDSVR